MQMKNCHNLHLPRFLQNHNEIQKAFAEEVLKYRWQKKCSYLSYQSINVRIEKIKKVVLFIFHRSNLAVIVLSLYSY